MSEYPASSIFGYSEIRTFGHSDVRKEHFSSSFLDSSQFFWFSAILSDFGVARKKKIAKNFFFLFFHKTPRNEGIFRFRAFWATPLCFHHMLWTAIILNVRISGQQHIQIFGRSDIQTWERNTFPQVFLIHVKFFDFRPSCPISGSPGKKNRLKFFFLIFSRNT